MAPRAPRVSVVIPAYRALGTIGRCLEALALQRASVPFEVVVVDSSDDGSERLVAERFPEVRLLHLERRTLPGAARNVGVRESAGELLAFTDADCVPPPDWVQRLVVAHDAGDYAAVGGSVANGRGPDPVALAEWMVEFGEYLPTTPARDAEFLPTCNACFRRADFERWGPFEEDLFGSEDRLLGHRLGAAGRRLRFEPGIVVEHLFRTRLRTYLRHQRALGAGAAEVRARFGLSDAWLARHPLRWGIGLARLARLERRMLGTSLGDFARFNLLLPWTASGVLAWGLGFATGRRPGEGPPAWKSRKTGGRARSGPPAGR